MQSVLNWLYMLWGTCVTWLFSVYPIQNISIGMIIIALVVMDFAISILVLRARR